MTATWSEDVFFSAFKAAGMLYRAQVATPDGSTVCADVGYSEPDDELGRTLSRQYEIEYQADDLPNLGEGDEIVLTGKRWPSGQLFKVRQAPRVPTDDFHNNSGHFRRVLLTRIAPE